MRFEGTQQIIFGSHFEMQDQCVYARSVLGRMVSTFTSSANSEGLYSSSQPQTNAISPGLIMLLAGIIALLILSMRNKKKTPESKLQ